MATNHSTLKPAVIPVEILSSKTLRADHKVCCAALIAIHGNLYPPNIDIAAIQRLTNLKQKHIRGTFAWLASHRDSMDPRHKVEPRIVGGKPIDEPPLNPPQFKSKKELMAEARKLWWKTYNEHLKSAEWSQFRAQVIIDRNFVCEECGSGKELQVHHKHYRNMGHEEPEDVTVLCLQCHLKRHPARP